MATYPSHNANRTDCYDDFDPMNNGMRYKEPTPFRFMTEEEKAAYRKFWERVIPLPQGADNVDADATGDEIP